MKILLTVLTVLVVALSLPYLTAAQMFSDNYRITTTVMSGGGGPMFSDNFQLNGTLGQPSPLIDPADPPNSPSFDLLTGFWYTLDAGLGCLYDMEGGNDGDVDGADLAFFINAFFLDEMGAFAMEFGRVDCWP